MWRSVVACMVLVCFLGGSCAYAVDMREDAAKWIMQLQSSDEQVRDDAVKKLLAVKDESSVHALADYMDYTFMNWRLKIEIMKFLGEMKHPRAVRSLAAVLENETCPALKWHAARALGSFSGNKDAVHALIKALPSEEEPQVREGIVLALGDLRDAEAVSIILPFLNNKSFALRNAAIRALDQIGSPKALPALRQALEQERDMQAQGYLRAAISDMEAYTAKQKQR